MDLQGVLRQIHAEVQPLLGTGRVADYIPALAGADPRAFGMAVAGLDGSLYRCGQALQPFSVQSISKLFALMLALQVERDLLWQRVRRGWNGPWRVRSAHMPTATPP